MKKLPLKLTLIHICHFYVMPSVFPNLPFIKILHSNCTPSPTTKLFATKSTPPFFVYYVLLLLHFSKPNHPYLLIL